MLQAMHQAVRDVFALAFIKVIAAEIVIVSSDNYSCRPVTIISADSPPHFPHLRGILINRPFRPFRQAMRVRECPDSARCTVCHQL